MAYLGFVVEGGTLSIDPSKTEAIRELASPTNVPSLRSVLGVFNYFRRFIKHYGYLIAPLSDLLRKDHKFQWTADCEAKFQKLKSIISSAPIVRLVDDQNLQFEMITDASGVALGGVLKQGDHVIAYESRKLSPTEQRYPTHERELLAILHCFKKWRHYLEGATTVVRTDHASLRYFNSTFDLSRRMTRWSEYLARFTFEIQYLPGRENNLADALSRPANVAVISATDQWDEAVLDFVTEHRFDAAVPQPVIEKVRAEAQNFRYDSDIEILYRILKNGREVPWTPPVMRADLIARAHLRLGHQARQGITDYLRQITSWSTLKVDVARAVSTCQGCQFRPAGGVTRRHAPMHPLPTSHIFSRWHVDFIGRLPVTANNNKWLLEAVDSTTRWPVVTATKDATAATVANFLYEKILMQYGAPEEILSDRGSSFMANVLQTYLKLCHTKQTFTSAYHPRTNSTAERYNQTLGTILTKLTRGAVRKWDQFLTEAVFATRVRVHRVTGYTPFELLYGVKPRVPGLTTKPNIFLPEEHNMWHNVRAQELESNPDRNSSQHQIRTTA